MIAASEIRDALSVDSVIARYGLAGRKHGNEYRLKACPRCRGSARRQSVAVNARTGQWFHHGTGCSGDVLDLVAACEGLDCKREFRKVIDIAAEIAGFGAMSETEREERVRVAKERAAREVIADLERRIAARSTAGAAWQGYARFCPRGISYLESRGLDASFLINRDAVRFAHDGIAVAIRGTEGEVTNTARRLYEGELRMLTLKDCSTRGYMIDCAADIRRDVVVTEGIMDSLTARQVWPEATILGASGAGLLPALVRSIVLRVKLARARLLVVPHDDEAGIENTTKACQAAVAAGLELGEELHLVDLPAKDLNEAWQGGWRP